MIRVADYIAETLAAHGVRHVFMVTGGGTMHLNDAFGHSKEPGPHLLPPRSGAPWRPDCWIQGKSFGRMT